MGLRWANATFSTLQVTGHLMSSCIFSTRAWYWAIYLFDYCVCTSVPPTIDIDLLQIERGSHHSAEVFDDIIHGKTSR
jgi:hypothetical protein